MRLCLAFAFVLTVAPGVAQMPDAPGTIQIAMVQTAGGGAGDKDAGTAQSSTSKPATSTDVTVTGKEGPVAVEPKRILDILPNYRAVSAGAPAPPASASLNFKIATEQSLDYSAFVFGGLSSLISEGRNTHASFGKGPNGFGQYYWRNTVDRVDRSYQANFLFPTLYHQDPRFYAMEKGPPLKRLAYAATRVVVTRTYGGRQTINFAGLSGRAGAEAVSTLYYPDRDTSFGADARRFGISCGTEAAFTVLREFYPDVRARFRRKTRADPVTPSTAVRPPV